jgi:hypothetical protein
MAINSTTAAQKPALNTLSKIARLVTNAAISNKTSNVNNLKFITGLGLGG